MLNLTLPWPPRELSPNARVHWAVKGRVARQYRHLTYWTTAASAPEAILERLRAIPKLLLLVEFCPPDSRARDRDNLLASIKAGLDGVADAIGIDDKAFATITVSVGETHPGGQVRVRIA